MRHKANFKIYFRSFKHLPRELSLRYVYNDGVAYIHEYARNSENVSISIWNRTEGREEVFEHFEVPLSEVRKIEKISHRTLYLSKRKEDEGEIVFQN